MIDINDLKLVNDTFGHQAGDQLLIAVSATLKAQFDDIGRCYRLGRNDLLREADNNMYKTKRRMKEEHAKQSEDKQNIVYAL